MIGLMTSFDFLSDSLRAGPRFLDAIITNPPYGKGNRDAVLFAEQALARCEGLVALLLTAKFDFGKTRRHLFADNMRFRAKIALLDRISWAGNGATGTEDHAWYVWESLERMTLGWPTIYYEARSMNPVSKE
jgi:predicted RNA methylase